MARAAEAAAAAVAAAAAAEAASARRDDDDAGEAEELLPPPLPPPPTRFPEAAGKRDLLGLPLLLPLLLSPAAPPSLLLSPPGPSVFLRRADAASPSEMLPPLPPLPPPLVLFPLPPLRREEAAAPLLSAAWKDVSRTLSPSGGPASTHEDEEAEEEVEGEEVDDDDVLLESSPAAEEDGVASLPPELPPGCFCCGVAGHADLRRYGSSLALRGGAREDAAGRRGAVGIRELAAAAVATGGAALLVF